MSREDDDYLNSDYFACETRAGFKAQGMRRDHNELVFMMRELPADVVVAYFKTDYVVSIKGKPCAINLERDVPRQVNQLVRKHKAKSWSIITACNPFSQERGLKENRQRNLLLQKVLDTSGHVHFPAVGRRPGTDWEEPGFMVLGLSYYGARALGTAFQQNAVIHGVLDRIVEFVCCDRL